MKTVGARVGGWLVGWLGGWVGETVGRGVCVQDVGLSEKLGTGRLAID